MSNCQLTNHWLLNFIYTDLKPINSPKMPTSLITPSVHVRAVPQDTPRAVPVILTAKVSARNSPDETVEVVLEPVRRSFSNKPSMVDEVRRLFSIYRSAYKRIRAFEVLFLIRFYHACDLLWSSSVMNNKIWFDTLGMWLIGWKCYVF